MAAMVDSTVSHSELKVGSSDPHVHQGATTPITTQNSVISIERSICSFAVTPHPQPSHQSAVCPQFGDTVLTLELQTLHLPEATLAAVVSAVPCVLVTLSTHLWLVFVYRTFQRAEAFSSDSFSLALTGLLSWEPLPWGRTSSSCDSLQKLYHCSFRVEGHGMCTNRGW